MKIFRALIVVGAGALVALGVAASPASAATSDPVLVAHGSVGGSCSGSADVSWSRAANVVTINSQAHSSFAFAACRLQADVKWTAGGFVVGEVVRAIPTACALTDPTCPSTVFEHYSQGNCVAPFAIPFADTVTVTISGR
jgi:hypothetical protein